MSLFPQFDADPPAQSARLAPRLRTLAGQGISFGTSSWKYEGWLGSIYRKERYTTRGKHSKKKFEETCLAEYAETFPTVCGDFAFYQFPTAESWARLFDATPADFRFAFKVPEEITVAVWPGHARYGARAGQWNESFLDAELFDRHFARPLRRYQDRLATLIFEFGTFNKATFPTAADFMARLDPFLGTLPEGFRYGVEIRNPEYLSLEYFGLLATHNVAHVFNAWTRMPGLDEQATVPEAFTADFAVVRALLQRGRLYEQAVRLFEPYREVQEPDEGARAGMVEIVNQSRRRKKPAFLFVNNRLEGNAPGTIEAVVGAIAP
ncbi:MAG TPA: DUF72 domain-containing protein [Isosphaeraceae bacterium]|jgi:uncharacterized protein YecE (DUF72 family)|nr:DUF72 domain-containing protein [Isosphaeraceae bacterium]